MPNDVAVKDFLNPKSMITPGVAGGITMLIANTLWVQFSLHPKRTGLTLSFLLGLLVFSAVEMALWQRMLYWLLNSLIIFSMGIGANSLGASAGVGARSAIMPASVYAEGGLPSPEESRRERVAQRQQSEWRGFFGGDWIFGSNPPYDAATFDEILKIGKSIDRFYGDMLEAPEAQRQYAKYSERYVETETDLRSLLTRNRARPLNEESITINETILTLWVKYKNSHQQNDTYRNGVAKLDRNRFSRLFAAAANAEMAKRLDSDDKNADKPSK